MSDASIICFSCSHKNQVSLPVPRKDECEKCGYDLHACLNCRFYEANSYNECKEPQADKVQDKDRANFCSYFEPGSGNGAANKSSDLLSAAEALFKK